MSETTITASTFAHNEDLAPAAKSGTQRRKTRPATFVDLVRLYKAAGALPTKKALRELLLTMGLRADTDTVDSYLEMSMFIRNLRSERTKRRFHERFGCDPVKDVSYPRLTRFGPLPQGTPTQRLEAVRKAAILKCAKSCFRHGAAGGSSFEVEFAGVSSQVKYEVNMGCNRDTYGGSFKGWLAHEDHHHLCVPADWRKRVEIKGLAILDGMMTLDAHLIHERDGVAVHAAVWARQSRAYQVVTERGYLATGHGLAFHGESAEEATRGLERKLRAIGRGTPVPAMNLDVEGFVRRFSKYAKLMVSIDDARDTGACEFGIRSWCEAVGIDMEQQEVTMQRLLQGFAMRPQEEVRHTVLHAVRNRPRS